MSPDLDPERLLAADLELERMAASLGGAVADADEARQDAWLAAVEAGPDEAGALSVWLRRALRFRLWRRRRGEARRRRAESGAAKGGRRELGPVDILERQELRQRLVEAVVALPEPYRRPVILRFYEGLPPRKIATRMAIPVETVRSRLRRAMAMLRQELDRHYGARALWLAPLLAVTKGGLVGAGAGLADPVLRVLNGALIVSAKTKIAAALVVVLSLGAVAWWFGRDEPRLEFESSTRTESAAEVAAARRSAAAPDEVEAKPSVVTGAGDDPGAVVSDDPAEDELATDGRLELTFVHAGSGRPARDMPVRLLPFGVTDPFFRETSLRTDRTGRLMVAGWPVGTTLVQPALGGMKRLKLEAGATLEATIEIPAGTRVRGIVKTPEGQPVSGAEIVTSEMGHAVRGGAVALSGQDGRFEIENFGPDGMSLVGARMKAYQPSPMVLVFPSAGAERELELVLGGPAARLIMTVVDPEGAPVAGARCIVGPDDFDQFQLEDGSTAMRAGEVELVSNEEGRLVFESLVPGDCPYELRAAGFAARSGTVRLDAGQTAREQVVLGAGGTVTGIVLDPEGKAVVRAEVTLGRYGSLSGHYMRSDAEGRFSFSDVAAGRVKIRVEAKGYLELEDEIVVTVGETTTWTGTLGSGPSITGIVLDDAGNPLAGMSIAAEAFAADRWSGGFAKSDDKGAFAIENLSPDLPHSVSVRGADGITQLARERAVIPGSEPLRFIIDHDMLGLGSAHGILVDPVGRPVASGPVSAIRVPRVSGGGTGIETADGEGRFVFEKLTPGTYYFSISAPDHGHQRSREYLIPDGEDVDLGEIRFEATGRVRVLIDDPAGLLGEKSSVWATHQDGGSTVVIDLMRTEVLSQPLAPGPYQFRLNAEGVADRFVNAEIRGEETTEVAFVFEPGRRVVITCSGQGEALDEVEVSIRDDRGRPVWERRRRRYGDRPLELAPVLSRRDHLIEVSDPLGRSARTTIRADEDGAVTLELR